MKFSLKKYQGDEVITKLQNDNLQNIIDEYKCLKSDIKYNANEIYPGKWVVIENLNHTYHSVRPLENIAGIANKYGMSVDELMTKNDLKIQRLFIGQRLIIK